MGAAFKEFLKELVVECCSVQVLSWGWEGRR